MFTQIQTYSDLHDTKTRMFTEIRTYLPAHDTKNPHVHNTKHTHFSAHDTEKKPTCVPRDTHMPLHTRTHACAVTHSRSRHYNLNLHYCQFRSHDYLSGIPLSVSAYVIYWFVIGCN